MHAVVTGGAGFIGRWLCRALLDEGWSVTALDDLTNGSLENIADLGSESRFDFIEGRADHSADVERAFKSGADVCLHLAARINVQQSIDNPVDTYQPDVMSTLQVLERCRPSGTPFLFMSSCMVYAPAGQAAIDEAHPTRPASPYAASKLAGEQLTLSYGLAYGHPVTVVRPFNTYGPYQRADGEGGVVSIFCQRALAGQEIEVFGDGTQTRDLLYVSDCAEFALRAALADGARGEVLNAGTGVDVTIIDLAQEIGGGRVGYRLAAHPHPQAEIARLVCDSSKARRLLGWHPQVQLAAGIELTMQRLTEPSTT